MSTNNNYGEIFCQAAEILAKNLIDKVSYDKTILCTIIKDDEKSLGKYRVKNGEAQFDAYTADTSLRKNDDVYVQIPGGDWNEQKLIVSKKINTINEPITYQDPFTSFISITNNLVGKDIGAPGLTANSSVLKQISLWSYNKPNCDSLVKDSGEPLNGYTRIGLSASFQTWLRDLGITKGDYGLKLVIELEPDEDDNSNTETEDEVNNSNIKYCQLTCADMLGNPFGYDSYYPQKKLFDISGIKKIQTLELWFYQKKDSFYNYDGTLAKADNRPPNIFVKDIALSFGYDANSFDNDTLIIYTMSPEKYSVQNTPLENNHKKLYTRWIHKFEDGTIRAINQDDEIDYNLYWYRYKQGERSHTVWSGVDWTPLSYQKSYEGELEYDIIDTEWQNYNENSTTSTDTPIRNVEYNQSWLLPDINKAEEKIKAILTYGTEVLYSNILLFSNSNDVISPATIDAIQALTINCEDDSSGNYLIYNIGGKILDSADSQKTREFKAYFNSASDNTPDNKPAELIEASRIEWIIPAKDTMIDLTGLTGNDPEDDGYYHIVRFGETGTNDIKYQNSQRYKIKNQFSQTYNNNTIKCIVTKDEIDYTSYKELTFGPAGTSGTNYTFVLDFIGANQALTIASDEGETSEALIARARLYDYTGKEIQNLEIRDIDWTVENLPENNEYISLISRKDGSNKDAATIHNEIEVQLNDKFNPEVLSKNYAILKATLNKQFSDGGDGWGDYDLCAYLPIPIRKNKNYQFISGTTTITYNSFGELDRSNFQNPYYLYHSDPDVDPIKGPWAITSQGGPYAPSLRLDKDTDEYTLKPVNMYVEGQNNYACVYCKDEKGDVLWSQPIYITQNKYPSSIINEWNGELTIDKDKNAILAAKIAAGKKNDDNTFSGVIMGDWKGDDGRSSAEKPITENTGIYGFQEGIASFGFRDDGTAFIGKPGKGRLEFDGNKSIIQSNSFASKKGGLSLDFDKGLIEVYEPDKAHNSNKSIIINAAATSNPFKIGDFFKVNWDGTLDATNGIFSGKITSDEGEIGGWEIGENTLKSQSGNVILDSNDDSIEGAILRTPSGGMILEGYLTVRDKDDNSGIGTYLGYMRSGGQNTNANLASDGIGMRVDSGSIGSQIKATTKNAGLSYTDGEYGGWLTMDSNGFSVGTNRTSIIAGDSLARLSSGDTTAISVHYTKSGIDPDGTNWNDLVYENAIEVTLTEDKEPKPIITFCADKDNQHGIYARFA